MSDAITQLGTAYKIGYGSLSYTGYLVQGDFSHEQPRDIEQLPDENDAIVSELVSRPRVVLSGTFAIEAAGSYDPPAAGATVTITTPAGTETAGRVDAASAKTSRKYAFLDITVVKYPDITYS